MSTYRGVNVCLALCLKCESASRHFQPEEGPSRGILSDCEIFANLRLKLYGAVLTCLHVSPQYVPRDVRGVPGPRAGAGGGGALQGGRAERGDQAAEYWGPAQIPRSVLDMQ